VLTLSAAIKFFLIFSLLALHYLDLDGVVIFAFHCF